MSGAAPGADAAAAKTAATALLALRRLKPTTAKGYEALLSFYFGWYRGELPPFVVMCLGCGRYDYLLHKEPRP